MHLETLFVYDAPPPGEVAFPSVAGGYRREIQRCAACGHCVAVHDLDLAPLYRGEYVQATYADEAGMRCAFERIVGLSEAESDNAGRVARILAYAARRVPPARSAVPTVLDVGSGLCVFLHRIKAAGWRGTALDPDARAVRHARETVGVDAVHADFMTATGLATYDAVTFNKVLEHVRDPVTMLARARPLVRSRGFVYVELPDAETAALQGPGREEFFVDHWHVFSLASVALLARRAGFAVAEAERIREPSSKFTLRAFLVPAEGGSVR